MDERHPGVLPRQRERRDARENRQRLLAAAKRLFAAQGVDATSMHEIARTAGVGQGTLYRHFADKAELCHALLKEDVAAFQERVGAIIDSAAVSPLARLETLIAEKIRMTESHLPLFAAIEETAAGARRTKPFRGPFYTWMRERTVALLAEAVERGEVAELDIEFSADAILAAVAPPLYSHQRHELGYSSGRILAGMRRLFIDGLRLPAPPPQDGG
ncbi:MAG: TetR/AcrR family transcriptional regulator [Chloroflexota bacterium]